MIGVDLDRHDLWELVDCPLCDAAVSESKVVAAFVRSGYRRCGRCQLVYLSPRLREDAMLELYRDGTYFEGSHELGYDRDEMDEAAQARTFRRRLSEITAHASGSRWLDVGCGLGFFLEAAREAGFDARGLDLSRQAAERSPELREFIDVGGLDQGGYLDAAFDVVTLFDVIEHVYDLHAFSAELARIARPGGIVAIATPNYDSWLRRLLGSRSVSFKAPEHVTYFTAETLARALGESFSPVHTKRIGQYCSWPFLRERLESVSAGLGRVGALLGRSRVIEGGQYYVPSGSILALFERR